MRKKINIAIVMLISAVCWQTAMSQDLEHTQFYLNMPSTNPGFTGMEDFWDLKISFRQGANNFNVKNKSYFVSAYGVLNPSSQTTLTNNTLRTSDPNLYSKTENKAVKRKILQRHGIGGMLSSKEVGTYKLVTANINYAYHLPLTDELRWSLGTSLRYHGQQIGFDQLTVRDEVNDVFYQQLLLSNQGRLNTAMLDFGSAIYSEKFYVGVSSMALINQTLGTSNFNEALASYYSLQMGVFLKISANLELNPLVKLDYSQLHPLNSLINARLRYKRMAYVGVGYQSTGKLSAAVGFTPRASIGVNYSYDHYLGALSNFNVNVHEVVLGIGLFNKYGLNSKIW